MPIPQTQTPARMQVEQKRLKLLAYFKERPPRTFYQYQIFFNVQLPPEAWDSSAPYEEERINTAWHTYYNAMHCLCWNAHYHPTESQLTWNEKR